MFVEFSVCLCVKRMLSVIDLPGSPMLCARVFAAFAVVFFLSALALAALVLTLALAFLSPVSLSLFAMLLGSEEENVCR